MRFFNVLSNTSLSKIAIAFALSTSATLATASDDLDNEENWTPETEIDCIFADVIEKNAMTGLGDTSFCTSTPKTQPESTPMQPPFTLKLPVTNSEIRFGDYNRFEHYQDLLKQGQDITFEGKALPADLNEGLVAADYVMPGYYNFFLRLAFKESSLTQRRCNTAKACGYFQVTGNAAGETTNRLVSTPSLSPLFSPNKPDLNVLREHPVSGALISLDHNRHYLIAYARKTQQEDIPNAEAYMVYWRGIGGALKAYNLLQTNPDAPAYSIHKEGKNADTVQDENHKTAYYDFENKKWRTIREFYDYMSQDNKMGSGVIKLSDLKRIGNFNQNEIVIHYEI